MTVVECDTPTAYGPCAPYATLADLCTGCDCTGLDVDAEYPCDGLGPDAALVESALLWASRRVFMATGYQFFGCCEATIRPCRQQTCGVVSATLPDGFPWTSWLQPEQLPAWASGLVPVWACSCSADDCSCTSWDRIPLPLLPAREVVSVQIDGDTLDPSSYTLVDSAWLLRVDGERWPTCQAVELPDGDVGTWSVTYRHGLDLPPEGVPLVAQYACELARACKGGDCSLGPGIRVVHRDGVEFAVAEPADYRERNLTGFGPLDDWISLLLGGHVSEPPRIYRPGREQSSSMGVQL